MCEGRLSPAEMVLPQDNIRRREVKIPLKDALADLRNTALVCGEEPNQEGLIAYLDDRLAVDREFEGLTWPTGTRGKFLDSTLVRAHPPFQLRGWVRQHPRPGPELCGLLDNYEKIVRDLYAEHITSFRPALISLQRFLYDQEATSNPNLDVRGWRFIRQRPDDIVVGLAVYRPGKFFDHATDFSRGVRGYGVGAAFATICLARIIAAEKHWP